MKKIRIMLAEDNALMREALVMFLALQADMVVVAQAVNGQDLLAQLDFACPDVICMDVNMDKLNGIEATRRVLHLHPQIKVIGLSTYSDTAVVTKMVQAGARGYVVKGNAGEELEGVPNFV